MRTIRDSAPELGQDKFISPEYVNRWGRVVEQAEIRLHPVDIILVQLWVDRLREDNVLLFLKDMSEGPPLESNLDKDAFVLCIQTPFQLNTFRHLGNGFIGIDATHNVTHYKDLLLFTIITRNEWGRGAWPCFRVSGSRH